MVVIAVVVAVLRGPLSSSAGVAEAGLEAMWNLAINDENERLLVDAGAHEGERVYSTLSLAVCCPLSSTLATVVVVVVDVVVVVVVVSVVVVVLLIFYLFVVLLYHHYLDLRLLLL